MITTYNHCNLQKLDRNRARKLAQRVWNFYKSSKCHVEINFVAGTAIMDLHEKYFQKRTLTDVITFNLGTGPEGKEIGEIYICPEFAQNSAQQFNCTFEQEIDRLVVHGMLHFVGFDDSTAEERQQMRRLENRFLDIDEG